MHLRKDSDSKKRRNIRTAAPTAAQNANILMRVRAGNAE